MSAPRLAQVLLGRERLGGGEVRPRHRHAAPYAAVVLRGGYLEAGDAGRWTVGPGDVVVHGAFEAHLDRVGPGGAEVLNLELGRGSALPAAWRGEVLQAADPDALARLAERDPPAAAALLERTCLPAPAPPEDWPDRLASALRRHPELRLEVWAAGAGLAPATVSRGFRLAYGVSPRRFRAEARARRALAALAGDARPLAEVALACGFADQPHLCRAIAALTGAPPSAWRQASSRFKTPARSAG